MMAIHLMLPPTNSRTRPSVEAARSAATAWATSSVVMMEDLRDRRSVGRGDKGTVGCGDEDGGVHIARQCVASAGNASRVGAGGSDGGRQLR